MLKVTLDTNCLFDYFERNSEDTKKLIEFQDAGKIEIAVTTRVKADTFGRRKDSPIWQKLQNFPCVIIPTVGRWGVSYWREDMYAGEEDKNIQKTIQSCIGNNPKRLNDVDHLIGHIKAKRDIFVTNDGDFIKHRDCLSQRCKTKIMTPQECVEYINNYC